jgi:hypothetical protein
MTQRFRPPIPLAELSAIRERNPGNADVIALLWEIRRLQVYALDLDQVMRSEGKVPNTLKESFAAKLANEPIITEQS